MDLKAFITGCAGTVLTDAERDFFAAERPCGLILFARNVESPEQIRALIASFKEAVGSDELLILIDQEGGRVQRLRPPHWRAMPPQRCYGDLYAADPEAAKRAAFAGARLMAAELHDLDINVNCTPCIDVPQEGAHDIIGDRAFSTDPDVVSVLGRAVMDGTLGRGCAAGDQACAGPWPGPCRQPQGAAPDRGLQGGAGGGRFPPVSGPCMTRRWP